MIIQKPALWCGDGAHVTRFTAGRLDSGDRCLIFKVATIRVKADGSQEGIRVDVYVSYAAVEVVLISVVLL